MTCKHCGEEECSNTITVMTIKQLHKQLADIIKTGHGDKIPFVAAGAGVDMLSNIAYGDVKGGGVEVILLAVAEVEYLKKQTRVKVSSVNTVQEATDQIKRKLN